MNKEGIIVVTGAAGFIGSAVCRHLNEMGYLRLVLVDDIAKSDKWKNLIGKSFCDFICKDALFLWIEEHIEEIKGIVHLGACSNTMEKDGNFLMENNFRYTQHLCQLALKHGIRFIYASSAATYGNGDFGFSDDVDLLEDLVPLNLYGFSKHLFDLWAKQASLFDQIVGLKYFNVFGPNEDHKGAMASMVYKMFPKITKEGKVYLFKSSDPEHFADGEQCRDFIYVKDVARMTCSFLFNNISGIFNLGRGKPTTWNQLAHALFDALGKQVEIAYIEMPQELKKQYQNYTCADMEKFFKLCQTPQKIMGIDTAVEDYVNNHLLVGEKW